jgi:hypothetical protein
VGHLNWTCELEIWNKKKGYLGTLFNRRTMGEAYFVW